MPDDPVRVVAMTNEDGGPSQPVRITNMDALVDALRTLLEEEAYTGDTVGSHTEDPALWEDLRFPAQGINPVGSPAPATLDNGADYPGTLLFAGNQENVIAGVAQLPHAWKEGTVISPHIHWTKVTADGSNLAVDWEFRYRIASKAGTFSSWSAWQDHTLVVGDNTSAEKHNLSTFPDIDMTGYLVSDMLVWSIRRNGNTDAYNGQTRLLEFDIHYQAETLGSVNRASK
jgi:hypothetical protein